ncbi:MAG: ThuA domain-containing protein, partial [Oscillospiraceae bacterium]|nr:ThuA domain-containing protein [Oscillospiraceae bacterium]
RGFPSDPAPDAKDFGRERLAESPAVLLSKCDEASQSDRTSWKTEAVQRAFAAYVENGGGLLAVHTALVAGKDTGILDRLIGSRFTYHPNACPVTVQPVKRHPVAEGVGMFCETDEHYRLDVTAPDADIFMASYSPPQGGEAGYLEDPYHNTPAWVCAAGYTRTQGKGRVCVLSPGHCLPVWHNPQFQRLLENALRWCAGER